MKRRSDRRYLSDLRTNSTVPMNATMTNATTSANTSVVPSAMPSVMPNATQTGSSNLTSTTPTATNTTQLTSYYPTNSIDIFDVTNTYVFSFDDTGNFAFEPASVATGSYPFTVVDNMVMEVGLGQNYTFYYPAEFAALGVSRWRNADIINLPTGSEMVVMTPLTMDDGTTLLQPVALTSGQLLTPVYCLYQGTELGGKVFLADPTNVAGALNTLLTADSQCTITGGVLAGCVPVTLTAAMGA